MRFLRAVPVVGLVVNVLTAPPRFAEADADDAAYRAMMASMGSAPKLPHATAHLMRGIFAGEVSGHLAALLVGGALLWSGTHALETWLGTWALAFVLDGAFGAVAFALSSRRFDRTLFWDDPGAE